MASNNLLIKSHNQRIEQINLPFTITKKRLLWISQLRVGMEGHYDGLETFELYSLNNEFHHNYPEFKSFDKEVLVDNTRIKLPTETVFEIDKLPKEQAVNVICEVALALIRNGIHFVIFYAQGQRSPHIRIYDLLDLAEVIGHSHQEAQKEFWKTISPQLWTYADQSVWMEKHPLQLEFALHYKYGTLFDLIYEHLPTPKKEKQEVLFS